jgi:hypothetical protein
VTATLAVDRRDNIHSRRIDTVDYLASVFLELQRKAAKLYDEAYRADIPHEQLKERLMLMVDEFGTACESGSKTLKGNLYELKVALGASSFCDPDAVTTLRYGLIRRGIAKGLLTELFTGTVRYTFKESARAIIERMELPEEVRKLYQQCISNTPILTVSPLPTTRS